MKFSSFNLKKELLQVLNEKGYVEATTVQEKVIPKALKERSLLVKSETGSGKTHAFLIPLLNNLDYEANKTQVIIVSPTAELALQTARFARQLTDCFKEGVVKLLDPSISSKIEGESLNHQNATQPLIIVGTPGRIIEVLIKNRNFDRSRVKSLVLDEADMLLDTNYLEDVSLINDFFKAKQRLVFTATMKEHLLKQTQKYIQVDEVIDVDGNHKTNHKVRHHLLDIKHRKPLEALMLFLKVAKPYFTLVFSSKKEQVKKIYEGLNKNGIECGILNGDLDSRERKTMLKRANLNEFNLIVCSDVASRGLDLKDVTCIVSLDLPSDLDYYYHRAGRSGRYDRDGDSYIFYDDDNKYKLENLKKTKLTFDELVLREEGIKPQRKKGQARRQVNEVLEAKIKREVSKVRSYKVKPNYKKKVKLAVMKAKRDHKKQIIRDNIIAAKKAKRAKK